MKTFDADLNGVHRDDQVRKEHMALSARLLSLMRKIDLLEARSAGALGLFDSSCPSATAAISRSLDAIEAKLAPSAPSRFLPAVREGGCDGGRADVC